MKQIAKKINLTPLIFNILVLTFVCNYNITFAQVKTDAKFHRHREISRPETYRMDHIEYRKSDNAVVGIYGVPEYAKGFTSEERAWGYIEKNARRFGLQEVPRSILRHHFTRNGSAQSVVRYRQIYKGIPVDENEIVLTMNKKGEVVFVTNNTKTIDQNLSATPRVPEQTAIQKALRYFSLRNAPEGLRINKVFHFTENRFLLCYRISFKLANPTGVWIIYVDAQSGKVADVYDSAHYQCAPSGSGSGNVFLPDPISTSGAMYGMGGFIHDNDANNTDLDAQLRAVNFPVGDPFSGPSYLQGEYAVDIAEECAGSGGKNWNFNRSHDCFEEVMCYYHISQNMCYYKNQLDGNSPTQFANAVFPDAARFAVGNGGTFYDETEGKIYIGIYTGDNNAVIEAGEDAAVIIHELGHGINDWMTGGGLSENEGLKEGFADYWAQSYIRSLGLWKEFESGYHWVSRWFMFTTELPDSLDRTTDFVVTYPIGTEVQEVGQNVKNFNNIVWKNLTILEKDEFTDPTGVVYLRVAQPGPVNIIVNTPDVPGNIPCTSQGTVHIELEENLYTLWKNNGEYGEGFIEYSPGAFQWTEENMQVEEIPISDTLSHVLTAIFEPDEGAVACSFDIIQKDSFGAVIGGERFVYEPEEFESLLEKPAERTQPEVALTSLKKRVSIFPVPVHDNLQVNIENLDKDGRESIFLHVYDAYGNLLLIQTLLLPDTHKLTARLDVGAFPAGLYYLQVSPPEINIQTVRFIKF